MSFLSFKITTHAYLLKISITHYKNGLPLLYLSTNYILVKSAQKMLSLKEKYTLKLLV